MEIRKKQIILLISLVLMESVFMPSMVFAGSKNGNGNGNGNGRGNSPVSTPARSTTTASFLLNNTQRTQLISLIRGENSSYNYLISDPLRVEIANQVNSLPPGIRKQLMRGKGLPPGIAKKVLLPRTVNNYLGLENYNCDIFVIGSDVVLINSVSQTIIDIVSSIF